MPRLSRGKTETIKDRAVYVYLPSLEIAEDWKRRAGKSGVSISKFVIERVAHWLPAVVKFGRSLDLDDVVKAFTELVVADSATAADTG